MEYLLVLVLHCTQLSSTTQNLENPDREHINRQLYACQ